VVGDNGGGSGVVDHDVEPAMVCDGGGDQSGGLVDVADVGL
jgi:hypothetical protein